MEGLERLAQLLGVSVADLVAEPGAASCPDDERQLVAAYRELPEFARRALRKRATELLEAFAPPSPRNPYGQGGTQ